MFNTALIEKFEEFKKDTGKYHALNVEEITFDKKKLYEVSTITMGQSPDKSSINNNKDGIPFYQGKTEFTDKYIGSPTKWTTKSKKSANKNDILISMRAPAGSVNLATESISIGRGLAAITVNDNISNNYLFPYLKNMEDKVNAEQDNGGFYSSMTKDILYDFDIFIPNKIDDIYDTEDVQQAIIEFLDYQKEQTTKLKKQVKSLHEKTEQTKTPVLNQIFQMKEPFILEQFNKWAKRKQYHIKGTDINFGVKRIHSNDEDDIICEKRMGFTPQRDPEGDINWFTVADMNTIEGMYINSPDTKEKTTMDLIKKTIDKNNTGKSEKLIPIQKGNILISFKLSVGTVKIYNSEQPAYCNEAIDILIINDDISNEYIAHNCIIEYPKYGTKTNNGMTLNDESKQEIKIMIPNPTNTYSSIEIQTILVEFIEAFNLWRNKVLNLTTLVEEKCNILDNAFLNEIFKGSNND